MTRKKRVSKGNWSTDSHSIFGDKGQIFRVAQSGDVWQFRMWFDRLPDENNRGLTPESLPQVITSRSRFNQGGGYGDIKKSKREVKIDAVEEAIDALDAIDNPGPTVYEVAANSARLRAMLKSQE